LSRDDDTRATKRHRRPSDAKEIPMAQLPGTFVWFEHLSEDVARARAFYEALFGWNTEKVALGGGTTAAIIHNGSAPIGGYAAAPTGTPTQWMSYLSVADVDSAYKAALAAGAKSVVAPTERTWGGRMATIADPTGGVFSLWRGDGGDGAESEQTPVGGWIWNELTTEDDEAALAFYEKAFGFEPDPMEMPDDTYHVLKHGGKGRAGVIKAPDPSLPTMWTPYVRVDDADRQAARAREFGASLLVAPADIQEIGRFAVLVDPQGAVLAMLAPGLDSA
jgi:predicted enzyme related to lactoylglutathione lyase